MLDVAAFYGARSGDSIANAGGFMRGNGGEYDELAVVSMGITITAVFSAIVFPVPASEASVGFTIGFLMVVASADEVLVLKIVALEGSSTIVTFPVCAFLVG